MPDTLYRQVEHLAAYALPSSAAQIAARAALWDALGADAPSAVVDALRAVGRAWSVETWASRRAFKLAGRIEDWLVEQEAIAA